LPEPLAAAVSWAVLASPFELALIETAEPLKPPPTLNVTSWLTIVTPEPVST
jgi:hypothetical protein